MREWFVIENSFKNSVFADEKHQIPLGYIPRDAVEKLLPGKNLDGNIWFTREEGDKMRAHPEWRETEP